MDIAALGAGFALPWSFGIALFVALSRRDTAWNEPGELAWALGCGWFAGTFLLTLWMRVVAALGGHFGILIIVAPLAVVTGVLVWFGWRRGGAGLGTALRGAAGALAGRALEAPRRALWLAMLGWLGVRFALLLAEVLWRPLYPWDAWTQWATKARVWFALKTMAPFVTAPEWLNAMTPGVYFDSAPHYPATVPLTQVWAATVLGRWDDSLVNLPWWLTGVAFGFAIYGFLAQQRFGALFALLGTWLVLSMPILNVHIALAGYADLAMATYFTVAVLASFRWIRTQAWADAGLALLLLVACVTIKNPGKIWVLTLLPGLIYALLPRYGPRVAAATLVSALIVAVILASSEFAVLGYRLHLAFALPWRSLAEAYFALGNWHLLWYGAIAVAILARRHLLSPDLGPLTVVILAGLMFLLFGFTFSNASRWVDDQSTVNRATLHLAPLVVVWALLAFRAWVPARPFPAGIAADLDPGAGAGARD